MGTKLSIDLDEVALNIREDLDLAHPHIYGELSNARPQSALKKVMVCWALADLILDNLNPTHTYEIERFESLRAEARKLIMAFWQVWQLFPVQSAEGKVSTVQVKPDANGKKGQYIQTAQQARVVHRQRKKRVDLSSQQKAEIREYFTKLGHNPTHDDIVYIMNMYSISENTVKRYTDPVFHQKERDYYHKHKGK